MPWLFQWLVCHLGFHNVGWGSSLLSVGRAVGGTASTVGKSVKRGAGAKTVKSQNTVFAPQVTEEFSAAPLHSGGRVLVCPSLRNGWFGHSGHTASPGGRSRPSGAGARRVAKGMKRRSVGTEEEKRVKSQNTALAPQVTEGFRATPRHARRSRTGVPWPTQWLV